MGEGFTQVKEADILEFKKCKQLSKLHEIRYGGLGF